MFLFFSFPDEFLNLETAHLRAYPFLLRTESSMYQTHRRKQLNPWPRAWGECNELCSEHALVALASWEIWGHTRRRNLPGWPKGRILWPNNLCFSSGAGSALSEAHVQDKPPRIDIIVINEQTKKQTRIRASPCQFMTDGCESRRWDEQARKKIFTPGISFQFSYYWI